MRDGSLRCIQFKSSWIVIQQNSLIFVLDEYHVFGWCNLHNFSITAYTILAQLLMVGLFDIWFASSLLLLNNRALSSHKIKLNCTSSMNNYSLCIKMASVCTSIQLCLCIEILGEYLLYISLDLFVQTLHEITHGVIRNAYNPLKVQVCMQSGSLMME